MVAIFTGAGTGFERGSGSVLGSGGIIGTGAMGRSGEQLSVNAATGNLLIGQSDEFLVGLGLDALVSRTYNSLGNLSDENGDNWRYSTDRKILGLTGTANSAGSTVHRISADGSDILYSWDAAKSAYTAKEGTGAYDTLTYNGTSWTWTDGSSQVKESYSAYGSGWRIVSQTDSDGNALTFSYNADKLYRVTTQDGGYVQYDWSGNNIIDILTGYDAGADRAYADQIFRLYDAAFDRVPDPSGLDSRILALRAGSSAAQQASSIYSSAEYQARGVAAMTNDQYVDFLYQSVLRRTADAAGRAYHIDQLNSGAMTRSQMLLNFANSAEHVQVMTTIPGRTFSGTLTLTRTRYAYDASNRLSTVTVDLSPGNLSVADGNAYTTSYTYSGTSTRVASITQSDGSQITISYDASNRVSSITEIVSTGVTRTSTLAYGAGYTTITDPLGQVTRLDYDAGGNLTKITLPAASTGATAQAVQFAYDAAGNVTAVTDALGNATTYSNFVNGLATTVTDRLGNVTTRTYGSKNELLTETTTSSDAASSSAAHTVHYAYDSENHLRFSVSAEGDVVEYRYTAAGQVKSTIEYAGAKYAGSAFDESSMNAWVGTLNPTIQVKRTDTAYDLRGNATTLTDYAELYSNRLTNPEFNGTAGWALGTNPNNIVASGSPYAGTWDGKPFVKAEINATAAGQIASISTDGNQWVDVYPGETLFAQVGVQTNGTAADAQLYVWFLDASGAVVGGSQAGLLNSPTAFDTKISGYVNVPTGAVKARLEVYTHTSGAGSGFLAITAPILESASAYPDIGANRVQDSRFEEGATGWWTSQSQPNMTQGPLSAVTDAATGKHYLQQTFRASNTTDTIALVSTDYWPVDWYVSGGERLAVRAGVGGTAGAYTLTVQFYDAGANLLSESIVGSLSGPQPFNSQIAGFAQAPVGATRMRMVCYAAAGTPNVDQTLTFTEPYIAKAQPQDTIVPAFTPGVPNKSEALGGAQSATYSRTSYVYDQSGKLLSRQTDGRRAENYVYDGMGRVTAAVDVNGGTTSYVFDDANTKTIVTLASGLVQTSTYNKAGDLLSYSESPSTGAGYTELVTNGTFDSNAAGWLSTNGSVLSAVGGRLRVAQSATPQYGPGAQQQLTTVVGKTYRLRVNSFAGTAGSPDIRVGTSSAGTQYGRALNADADITFVATATTAYITCMSYGTPAAGAYVEFDNISLVEQPTSTNGYDQLGRLRWEVDATGIWSYHLYDNVGRKTADVSGAGELVEYKYDADNRLVATVSYATPLSSAQLASLSNENVAADVANFRPAAATGDRWNWRIYDKEGRVLQSIAGDGSSTINSYDSEGKLLQSTDYANKFSSAALAAFKAAPPTTVQTSWSTYTPPPPPPAESANQLPDLSSSVQWSEAAGITQAAATAIAGQPAWRYTLAEGQRLTNLDVQGDIAVAAGQTLTWTMTMMGTGNSQTTHTLGIDAGTSSNPSGLGSAAILSGPGSLAPQTDGDLFGDKIGSPTGLWSISGLSTSQATTVRFSYTFSQAATVNLSVFFNADGTAGGTATNPNDEIILSNPVVTTCNEIDAKFLQTGPNLLPDLSNSSQWTETNASQASAAAINGQPAWTYSATTAGTGSIQAQITASAGDTIGWKTSVQGPASGTIVPISFKIADAAGANYGIMKILSGPGTLTQDAQGLWTLTNYSSAISTVVQITHSFTSAATVTLQASIPQSASSQSTNSVILSTPLVTRTAGAALAGYTTAYQLAGANDAATRRFYDKDGLLIGGLSGSGLLTQIKYDSAGQKVEERHFAQPASSAYWASGTFNQLLASTSPTAADRVAFFTYDGAGQLRFVTDAGGNVTQTDYDQAGQATCVTHYAAPIAATGDHSYAAIRALLVSSNVQSNAQNRQSWVVYDSSGRAAYTIDAEGGVTSFTYNVSGQVTRQIQFAAPRSTASLPDKITMDSWATANASSAIDRTTRYYYDGSEVLRYTVDAEGYVTRKDFDAEGRETRHISWTSKFTIGDSATVASISDMITTSGSSWVDTWTGYDIDGRVSNTTDGEGIVTRYVYNANGTLQSQTVADGTSDASTTYFVYDGAGRKVEEHRAYGAAEVSVTRYSYDGLGHILTVTDPDNHVTTFTYDNLGNLATKTDAAGVTSYYYDAFGNVIQEVDKLGRSTYNYYDALNRLVRSRDAEDYITETAYTAFGEVASVTRRFNKTGSVASVSVWPTVSADAAHDATTSFLYDRLGRVTRTTDAEGYYENYTLNAFGDRVSVRNKLGGTITNAFDRRGLLVAETLPMASYNSSGSLVASAVTNTFTYDARGNRKTMVEASGLAEQRTTSYNYDNCDRLISKSGDALTKVAFSDFTSSTAVTVTTTTGTVPIETYSYDNRGNLIQVIDANGAKTFSYYDDLNRRNAEVNSVGTLTTWTYDDAGNKLAERVYGDFVALPAVPGGAAPNPVNSTNYRETAFGYDSLNRLVTTSVAGALVGTWNSTNNGVRTLTATVTATLTYDANGNVIKTADQNGEATWSWYDSLGRKSDQLDAEGYLTHWDYDAHGDVLAERRYATRWTGAVAALAPPAVATSSADRVTNFTYDENGNRLTERRTGVTAWLVNATNGALTADSATSTVSYTYNGLRQVLTKTEATGDRVTYNYDGSGRLTKEIRAAHADQSGASVTPTVNYYYDGLNNLTRTQQGGATLDNAADRITTYAYGSGGRLASMTNPDGSVHSYDYDAAGNLLRDSYTRTKSGGTTVTEGILYRRDLLGRILSQTVATRSTAASWTRGDSQNTLYDAYGQVSQRGVNGLWQEKLTYNNRGLVEKSNTGDGVWRFHVYDKAGNEVLTIESEGNDYSSASLATVLSSLGTYAGSTFVTGVNTTVSFYDGRNQLIQAMQPQRETSGQNAPLSSISTSQSYNAFGEVASQTDALGNVTTLTYNNMGRLISKVMPQVSVTSASGTSTTTAPTETYYYDLSGRLVAKKDANGFTTSRTLLAASGYGGSDAQVLKEFRPDGAVTQAQYDVFGDARKLIDELSRNETRTYDKMGRLLTDAHASGLTDNFSYDLLGQRITHWDNAHGSTNVETTDYDVQGRVVSTRDFAGDITNTSYSWVATVATALGTNGGWTKTTTQWAQLGASAKSKSETSDVHGMTTAETDFGGNGTTYTYDRAGRLTQKQGTVGSVVSTLAYTYYNSGLVATVTDTTSGMTANSITSTYTYDVRGYRTGEKYAGTIYRSSTDSSYTTLTATTQTLEDATITYDALGRLTSFNSISTNGSVSVTQEYDAAGNIRERLSTTPNLVSGTTTTTDKWFTYDAMNRMVIADGVLSGGTITGGTSLTYDAAGNRKTATKAGVLESYNYDADNQLTTVVRGGTTIASTTRNLLGQVTEYVEYASGAPTGMAEHRYNIVYNARGQVTSDATLHWVDGGSDYTSYVTNQYDDYGNMTRMDSNNVGAKNTWQSWVYGWKDGAVVSSSTFDKEALSSTNYLYSSSQVYDGLGRLQRAFIADGKPRSVDFALSPDAQVLARVQNDGSSDDPRDYHLFAGGVQVAEYTNNANEDVRNYDYQQLITDKASSASGSGDFWHGASTGTAGAETGTSGYDPINQITAGVGQNSRSKYVVQAGDSLTGIASNLWGDSSLWYLLANANGLSGPDAALTTGQALSVPLKGPSNTNNASMYRPYDPTSAVGDLSPTQVKPPKGNKCGAFGQILLVAIAVAVTIVTSGAALAALAPTVGTIGAGISTVVAGGAAGALGGGVAGFAGAVAIGAGAAAAGSIVSQGVGVATGIQSQFSWKGVALAALSGGIGAGVGGVAPGGGWLASAARGAASSALTQGVAVATGLQDKFDWAGVAAAGVGAGVGQAIGGAKFVGQVGKFGQRLTSNMASGIANAASRSLANGSDFGDNLMAALPDTLGQTIGNALADAATGPSRLTAQAKAAAAELDPTILDDPERFAAFRQTYKDTRSAIRNIELGDDPYANANALADTYATLLGYAADQQAAGQALAALRTPSDTVFADLIDGAQFASLQDVTVTGRYHPNGAALGLKLLDTLAIQAGNLGVKLGDAYSSLPLWARYGVTALGFAVDAAAGPIGFAVRRSVGYLAGKANEAAATYLSGRFIDKGYSPTQAALGGAGALLVGSLVLLGASGARNLLASGVIGRSVARFKGIVRDLGSGPGLARDIGILSDAARGKGNFGLGSASAKDALRLGKAWVGEGYTVASDGKTLVSADGLRQFRPPSFKPNLGITQANFEQRFRSAGQWQGNGHLDIGR